MSGDVRQAQQLLASSSRLAMASTKDTRERTKEWIGDVQERVREKDALRMLIERMREDPHGPG